MTRVSRNLSSTVSGIITPGNDKPQYRQKEDYLLIGVVHNMNTMLRQKQYANAISEFSCLVQYSVSPNAESYSAMIRASAGLNDEATALNFYQKMVESDMPVDTIALESLIGMYHRLTKDDQVINYYEIMLKSNIVPSSECHGYVVQAILKKVGVDAAQKFYDQMRECGIILPFAVRNYLTHEFSLVKDLTRVLELGSETDTPTLKFFSSQIRALFMCNAPPDEIFRIYQKCVDAGLATGSFYATVISGFNARRDLTSSEIIFNTVKNFEGDHQTKIHSLMIGGYVAVGRFDDAEQVFKDMGTSGISKNLGTYNAMLSLAVKLSSTDLARDILSQIDSANLKRNDRTQEHLSFLGIH